MKMKGDKHIQSFNEHQENLNIPDVSDSKNDWFLGKAVYLRNVCSKICGDFDFSNHHVYKEWRYLLDEKCKGNDTGILSWVNRDIKTPLINKFLLHNGFYDGEPIIYFIRW